jgi:hypothetical protein
MERMMPTQEHIQVDDVLVLTPSKGASIETIKSTLGSSKLVQSIASVRVAHVDNIAKKALKLFDPKALLQLLSGDDTMKNEKDVVGLTEEFRLAEDALDSALKSSKNSLDMVKDIHDSVSALTQYVQNATRSALKESAKIS